jgi:hypothetical protein
MTDGYRGVRALGRQKLMKVSGRIGLIHEPPVTTGSRRSTREDSDAPREVKGRYGFD